MDKQKEKLSMDEVKLKLDLIHKMNQDLSKANTSNKTADKASSKNKADKSGNKKADDKKAGGKKSKNPKKSENKEDEAPKKPKKEKAKKKTEKPDTSDDIDSETDTTTRKWEDKKGKNFLKGPFTTEEEMTIINSFLHYVYENNVDENDIIKLITEKQAKKQISIWPKIAECLPKRSVQSIHNYCHRKLNPYNYKGNWATEEIEKLLVLVKEHGPKWEIIGKELERTSTNVKDKYKQLGGRYHHSRSKDFNLILCLKLIKYIQKWLTSNDEEEASYEIFKHSYKFRDDLEEKHDLVFFFNESSDKFLIDSSCKESSSKVIIKNILKKLVDSAVLFDIVDKNVEISWSFVSEKMKLYSAIDCQNNWDKILREYGLEKRTKLNKDLKMIKILLKCDFENIDDVDFSLVKNKRTPEQNRKILEEYIRFTDIYSIKSLNEILVKVKVEIESAIVKDDDEDTSFREELKKAKPFDIIKSYREFLKQKRGRDHE